LSPPADRDRARRPRATALVIAETDLLLLCAWSRAARPRESCGLLLGRGAVDLLRAGRRETDAAPREARVEQVTLAQNLSRSRDRFELDPGDLVAADEGARARGLEIVGVWHSHPGRPPVPSAADREHAWSAWSYLIVGVSREGACRLRSWRLGERAPREEALRIA
jgi:proteasome lid subunit RPN8/RPN11